MIDVYPSLGADPGPDVLINPVWHALRGPHRPFALPADPSGTPLAVRYAPDAGPFAGIGDQDDPAAWAELAELVLPGERIVLAGPAMTAPHGWSTVTRLPALQMVGPAAAPPETDTLALDMQMVTLDSADVSDMLELVRVTQPGPFGAATLGLGTYLGFRRADELVAMAGQRFHPAGWRELSAICTHPDYRGRGLSRRLIRALLAATYAGAERAFLHVLEGNAAAIGLYESMGFTCHATVTFTGLHRPSR